MSINVVATSTLSSDKSFLYVDQKLSFQIWTRKFQRKGVFRVITSFCSSATLSYLKIGFKILQWLDEKPSKAKWNCTILIYVFNFIPKFLYLVKDSLFFFFLPGMSWMSKPLWRACLVLHFPFQFMSGTKSPPLSTRFSPPHQQHMN